MRTITQSNCSVIPPHMLRHMAEFGDEEQRKRVADTISHTEQLTTERRMAGFIGAPPVPAPRQKQRNIYDAGGRRGLPGQLVMGDGLMVSTDIEAMEAFEGSGATYDFYAKVFLRNSIDNGGMPLDSTIHYGTEFNNALWNGRQMIYGDGDRKLFNRFTASIDVIAHELTHGVTQFTAGLDYHGEAGALNEHISDAFGIMVKQYWHNETVLESDWLIGGELFMRSVHGVAVRSMKAPGTAYDDPILGKDPQPRHMSGYVHTSDDNGGVHINSGIPNHAFYRTATALGSYSWHVAGRIWYRVLTTMLLPHAGFQRFANATAVAAGELYGIGGTVQLAVAEGWHAVGLPVRESITRAVIRRSPRGPAPEIVN